MSSNIAAILADRDLVSQQASAARTAAIADSRAYTTAQINQLNSNLTGVLPFDPAEVLSSSSIGQQRGYASSIYQLNAATPGGLAPLGVGDGSPSDQALLVSRASGHAAAAGVTGGQGGTIRVVTNGADDSAGTTAGSLRKALKDHHTAFLADSSAKSWIVFTPGTYNIVLTADLNIADRNFTIDGRGSVVNISGGGAPGPIPFGVLAASTASGTTTLTLSATGLSFGGAALRVGSIIDVTNGGTTVYASALTVTAFDVTARTITVSSGTQNLAPAGATVILTGKTTGQLGKSVHIGGKDWDDQFGVGRTIPAGNIILHNLAFVSNWGGDIIDVGDAQDFTIRHWTDTVWVDHCSFSNPDPFHDSMFNIGTGSKDITLSWCKFYDHYKAVQFFNSTDGSGGTNPDGAFQAKHSFPPIPGTTSLYTTANPGPYRFVDPGGTPQHGNSLGLPLTIQTVTMHHCIMDRLGQRDPKGESYTELHLYNNKCTRWGVKADPISGNTITFPTPDEAPTGGSAVQIVEYGRAEIQNNVFEPYPGATGGALLAIKRTPGGKAKTGYTRTSGNVLRNSATVDPDYDPSGLVPHFTERYTYVLDPVDTLLENRLALAAGANRQGALWTYIGPATITAGALTVKDESTSLGTASTVNFTGSGVTAAVTTGTATVTVPGLTVKDEGSNLSTAVSSVDFVGSGVTATNTGGAVTVTVPGASGSALTVKDEGSNLSTAVTSVNFVGAGVTATNTGAAVTVTVPGGSSTVVAGQELAVATYWPISAQTSATTTSSSGVDIAAAGVTASWSSFTSSSLDCTFTVPPSLIIEYEISGYVKSSTTGGTVRFGVGDNTGTQIAGPQVIGIVSTGTTQTRASTGRRKLDLSTITGGGPSAGSTFTLRPQWAIGGGATATIDVGGVNGPVSMRVYVGM